MTGNEISCHASLEQIDLINYQFMGDAIAALGLQLHAQAATAFYEVIAIMLPGKTVSTTGTNSTPGMDPLMGVYRLNE